MWRTRLESTGWIKRATLPSTGRATEDTQVTGRVQNVRRRSFLINTERLQALFRPTGCGQHCCEAATERNPRNLELCHAGRLVFREVHKNRNLVFESVPVLVCSSIVPTRLLRDACRTLHLIRCSKFSLLLLLSSPYQMWWRCCSASPTWSSTSR